MTHTEYYNNNIVALGQPVQVQSCDRKFIISGFDKLIKVKTKQNIALTETPSKMTDDEENRKIGLKTVSEFIRRSCKIRSASRLEFFFSFSKLCSY